jgi:hypothetical protein
MLAHPVPDYLLSSHVFLHYLFFQSQDLIILCCHLSSICFLSDSILPSLSLHTSVIAEG